MTSQDECTRAEIASIRCKSGCRSGNRAPSQLIRTRNWMLNEGLPAPAALMTPAGEIRTARTSGSKPLASGEGTYNHGPLAPTDEYDTCVARSKVSPLAVAPSANSTGIPAVVPTYIAASGGIGSVITSVPLSTVPGPLLVTVTS